MVRLALLLIFACLVVGCAAPPTEEPVAAPSPAKPKLIELPEADLSPGKGGIWSDAGSAWLRVGDTQARALDLFPAPRGAKRVKDLPPTLVATQFEPAGWQDSKGRVAFGCISEKKRETVVLAMLTQEGLSATRLADLVSLYRAELGPESSSLGSDGPIRFYFWETKDEIPQRLMICAVADDRSEFTTTVAMGLSAVMDAIDANPKKAELQLKQGQKLLDSAKKATNTTGSTNQQGS